MLHTCRYTQTYIDLYKYINNSYNTNIQNTFNLKPKHFFLLNKLLLHNPQNVKTDLKCVSNPPVSRRHRVKSIIGPKSPHRPEITQPDFSVRLSVAEVKCSAALSASCSVLVLTSFSREWLLTSCFLGAYTKLDQSAGLLRHRWAQGDYYCPTRCCLSAVCPQRHPPPFFPQCVP